MNKTFVGFGFGPIQSALFVYEGYRLSNFSRFVMVDIDEELIRAVRNNRGAYTVNIARADRIDRFTVQGIEIYNPQDPDDFKRIVEAVAESDEMCTALPSVSFYASGGATGVVNLLAQGLSEREEGFPTIIYTAENNNRAAEILGEHLTGRIPEQVAKNVQILNTVIGKMSGVITDREAIESLRLATVTPDTPRAILVEEFNRILISEITLPGYRRGIEVFIEKTDLLPFEEAKLYGHNAIHALIAYLVDLQGCRIMAEAGKNPGIMDIARKAFIDESGAALIRCHRDLGDPLFTPEGYREYADDLLQRMVNPNLNDLVERVGRDHPRKLGIEDRIYGTMCLALENEVLPENLAMGAAAGVLSMISRREVVKMDGLQLPEKGESLSEETLKELLFALWGDNRRVDQYGEKLVSLTWKALQSLEGN